MSPDTMSDISISTNSTISIPKLADDGSNWIDYESKARNAMGSKGLIRYLDGLVVEPKAYETINGVVMSKTVVTPAQPEVPATDTTPAVPAVVGSVSGTPATDAEIEAQNVLVDAYWTKEYSARHIITNSVSPRLGAVIQSMGSVAIMWATVKADATDKSQMFMVDARLQNMRWSQETSKLTSSQWSKLEMSFLGLVSLYPMTTSPL